MTTEDPSANVVPIRPPVATITDLASFEAEVSKRLEEDYGDVSKHVALGRVDKVFLASGHPIEKGIAYPGLDGTVVAAIFDSDNEEGSFVPGDMRVYLAPKDFNVNDRYLVLTINRDTTKLSMRSTLLREDFVEAVVEEWETAFGPPEEEEEEERACSVDECEADLVYACQCQECGGKDFASCAEHRAQLDPDHLKEQGRPAVWQKIATPALPQ